MITWEMKQIEQSWLVYMKHETLIVTWARGMGRDAADIDFELQAKRCDKLLSLYYF